MSKIIGHILSGSLSEGFTARITSETIAHEIKTGTFVAIKQKKYTFFALITDLTLEVTNTDILLFPPESKDSLLSELLKKNNIFTTANLKPMIMLDTNNTISPVKTIPLHFTAVCQAKQKDIERIFGNEDDESKKYFTIGNLLDMQTPICINLEKLTERSNGIFGKTGTGKTFITRLVLAGLIKQKKAVNLIFDMHSEYGLQARKEGEGLSFVKGLKTLFPDKVAIFSIDPASTRRRGAKADVEVIIPYQAIQVEDILSLQDELNLHATAFEAAYLLHARYKQEWLCVLLSQGENSKDFAQEIGAHPESIAALYRKLKRLERLPFLQSINLKTKTSVIDTMMEYINKETSIIFEFGNYTSTFVYLLVANIITRRIHQEFITKTEIFLKTQHKADEPKKLLITIEEAHKFLNAHAAKQTIFGVIAREMRKYYVSLLIVDQRPSGIDEEIISQIGTKIIAQLNDEKDIKTVLTGTHNTTSLRTILTTLDSKQQALIIGHAITMPVVIETRNYNEIFYQEMSDVTPQKIDQLIKELF